MRPIDVVRILFESVALQEFPFFRQENPEQRKGQN
jgi:hypothetical protein